MRERLTPMKGFHLDADLGRSRTPIRNAFDMSDAADADIRSYKSFNDFFTRPLKEGLRPVAAADFVCPVDGAISQFGSIDDHHMLQAKGHWFTTTQLVGGDAALASQFRHGSFANLYLSPGIIIACTCPAMASLHG